MKSSSPKPWFSYYGKYYGEDTFFYKNEDFEWAKMLEANFSKIKPEIDLFLAHRENKLTPYFNVDLVSGKNDWNVDVFYFWGKKNIENTLFIPELEKILTAIPGFVSAAISVLEGNTEIGLHNGDTDATIRCHLPIKVPAKLPICGFEVGGEQRNWDMGKPLLFSDAQPHKAWNKSKEKRYILMFDIIKPEYLHQKKEICSNALSLIALQQLEYKYPLVKILPNFVRGIIRKKLKH